LQLVGVVQAITSSVQRTFGRTISFSVSGATAPQWMLPEAESIPIALTLNELLTNAVKHSAQLPAISADADVHCVLDCRSADVEITISNRATLPAGFNIGRIPGGVSGLGLVRALLPRRSASISLDQRGDRVVATVSLGLPGVIRADAV
jgi:two-component sensor histidine kinase